MDNLPTITTSGTWSAARPGDILTMSDGSVATVISVESNTMTIKYNWWTRFKRWCYAKWHWRRLAKQEAELRRRWIDSQSDARAEPKG